MRPRNLHPPDEINQQAPRSSSRVGKNPRQEPGGEEFFVAAEFMLPLGIDVRGPLDFCSFYCCQAKGEFYEALF